MESGILRPSERESIDLVEKLWDLSCKHLLGRVPGPEYRREIKNLLAAPGSTAFLRSPCVDSDFWE